MRRFLDRLYDGCAYLAGLFLILILIFTLLGVAGGVFDFYVRGTDAYAGYCMAAASFLALAHTFRKGEHIRVTLLIQQLTGRSRRWLELVCLAAAAILAGLFAGYATKMVWWSYVFTDVSASNDRTPLWIPQIGMALGSLVLFVALVDEFIQIATGKDPAAASAAAEPSHIE
ncbi:MAG: TRAP transporter small permease [Alphaproteobacteria bacterium]|nr:TRAP transporter small permease [Alphaproteobacteria bacterium]